MPSAEKGGFEIDELAHGAETLILSLYKTRQDSYAVQVSPDQLRVFENVGLQTDWHLKLPRRRNWLTTAT